MISIRTQTAEDIPAIRRVNELAFGQPAEANLVDALRKQASPHISLVAIRDGEVVGHIFFSPVTLENSPTAILGLAPMAVEPEYQNQGIGSQLVREGLKECQRIGYDVVVVVGHAEYYPRFGFIPASQKGLRCEYPVPDEVFMVAELKPNALSARGLVKYHPEFGRV
ncbi:MAG: GNAT family N-acetyltransferase [Pyrinomonadaceae bacterium]